MSSVRFLRMLALVGALALLGATPSAFASVNIYTVGTSTAASGPCNFSTIKDAVDAAAAHPGLDRIYIATNATYSAEAIVIDNQDLNIVGGFKNCGDFLAPSVNTTISGAGNGGHSVLAISGTSNVSLQYLTITGGAGPSGAGIDFAGNGSLDLSDVTISNNVAGMGGSGIGGGIYVNGSNGAATLTLKDNVLIQNNSALEQGGGIYLKGTAHLLMSGTGTQVSSNQATGVVSGHGQGGGIFVFGPARADISAPGIGAHGAIYNNSAGFGGGIYVQGGTAAADTGTLTLFTTDPAHPVFLDSNQASSYGGALAMGFSTGLAVACLFDMHISGNNSLNGSAVYSENGQLYLNSASNGACASAAMAAAVRCTPGPGCNEISHNSDIDATMYLVSGILQADRVIIRGNNARYEIHAPFGMDSPSHLSNCLIAGNTVLYNLINSYGSDFTLDGCTTADNTVDSGLLFSAASEDSNNPSHFVLTNSVISEAANYKTFTHSDGYGILEADYDLLSDTSTVTQGSHYFSADPQFVDPASGDYHLQPTSRHRCV
jgi:predicted outer membrane repeat protein